MTGVIELIEKKDLFQLREDISTCVGSRITLESKTRHNKSTVSEGVIANVYPSIFTVETEKGAPSNRTLSFSYTDVLTNAIEITIFDQG
jgi:uncharacterized protein Veg